MKTLLTVLGMMALPVLATAKEKASAPPLPSASLTDVRWGTVVNDAPFNQAELAGKVVVVEEWGVHCAPCIASLPTMAKLAKYEGKKGLVVVGMERQDGTKEEILKLLKSARVEYPVMTGGSAPGGTGTIPHACVFDMTGKLVYNGSPLAKQFEESVKKALREIKPKA